MFSSAAISGIILASISLSGVTGSSLHVRAGFDANNVHVGDPMILTVDFIGGADFESLHPPPLAKEADASVWKIDDASAKTETYHDARRLTYRVRPLKEGVLVFPSLTFAYTAAGSGETATVSTIPIPVHAKPGSQVALAETDEDRRNMPSPDGIVADLSKSPWGSDAALDGDGRFAWRRACADPSPEAFAKFDFPEARLNEAACHILAGNWARAMRIYSLLEWRIGQTPAIERGIVAALALKTGDANAELPMWRQVMRPVLRFAWFGRLVCLLSALALVAVVFALLRLTLKSLACIALALSLPFSARALSPFDEMDRQLDAVQRQMERQMQRMTRMIGGPGMSFTINGEDVSPPEIKAEIRPDKTGIVVGDTFNLVVSLEMPRNCTVSGLRVSPSGLPMLVSDGKPSSLTDAKSLNPSNVVRRMTLPVRCDAPFEGQVDFKVSGECTWNIVQNFGGGRSFRQQVSSDFAVATPPLWMKIGDIPGEDRPGDFTGIVGSQFSFEQRADRRIVETNDVVIVDATFSCRGFVPEGVFKNIFDNSGSRVVFRRYFVADGSPKTDDMTLSCYDTAARKYVRVTAPGVGLKYVPTAEEDASAKATVVVNAEGGAAADKAEIRFAPRLSSPVIGKCDVSDGKATVTETLGPWVRVDDGRRAGWMKKENLGK